MVVKYVRAKNKEDAKRKATQQWKFYVVTKVVEVRDKEKPYHVHMRERKI